MSDNTYQQALDLIDRFDDKDIKARCTRVQDREMQVEETLWAYMTSIFKHVQEDYEFKVFVQDMLRERLSGSDVDTLLRAYSSLNNHETKSLEVSLLPFAGGRNAETSPLLDNVRRVGSSLEEQVHGESSTEMLRAFDQLNSLLSQVVDKKEDK